MPRMFLRIILSAVFVCLASLTGAFQLQAQNDAAKVYKTNCTLCHSDDGSGSSPTGKALKAKDLRSDEVQSPTQSWQRLLPRAAEKCRHSGRSSAPT
jgi:mono/diheme cytochrome c family protein